MSAGVGETEYHAHEQSLRCGFSKFRAPLRRTRSAKLAGVAEEKKLHRHYRTLWYIKLH